MPRQFRNASVLAYGGEPQILIAATYAQFSPPDGDFGFGMFIYRFEPSLGGVDGPFMLDPVSRNFNIASGSPVVVAYGDPAGNEAVSAFVNLTELRWPARTLVNFDFVSDIEQLSSIAGFTYPLADGSALVGCFSSGYDTVGYNEGLTHCPLYLATRDTGEWHWEKIGTPPGPHAADWMAEGLDRADFRRRCRQ